MTWWQKEPGHQQLWCWRNSPRKFHSQQQKGQSCIVPGKWCSVVLFDLMLHMYINLTSLEAQFNSLAPGKFEWNFRHVIFKQILVIDGWGICCEIALIWMSLDFTNDQSTLVQVMVLCHQATSHYLNQYWPRSLSPSSVTRPQWVNVWYSTSPNTLSMYLLCIDVQFMLIKECFLFGMYILVMKVKIQSKLLKPMNTSFFFTAGGCMFWLEQNGYDWVLKCGRFWCQRATRCNPEVTQQLYKEYWALVSCW